MIQCVLVAKDKPSIKKWPKIDLAVDFLPLTKEHSRRSRHLLRHQYRINRLKKSIGTKNTSWSNSSTITHYTRRNICRTVFLLWSGHSIVRKAWAATAI